MNQNADRTSSSGSPRGKRDEARAETTAWNITGYLLAGPIAWGGIGWLVDRWLGTDVFGPLGLMLGLGLSLYLIWVRYGRA
jgi:F0F1-type ATP synthase assembly protein I